MTTQAENTLTSFRKTVLDNGTRILTSEMPHTRSVSITIFVSVGSRYETVDMAGISHLIEHLVFKGTSRRPTPKEISGPVEGVGGVINAGTEHELTVYWCKVARPHLEEVMDLLVDMLRNSLFRQTDLEKERLVVLEEQSMVIDDPHYRVETMLDDMLWPDHPLGRDVSGTRESVSSMTRKTILEFASASYTPSNMVISVAGDIEHDKVARHAASLFNGWATKSSPDWQPFAHEQSERQLRLEYRKTEQAHVSIGLPALSMTHPDRYALDLLSVILGEGMSSRLFLEVREKLGLAYDIHSDVSYFLDCGALVIGAGVDPKNVYKAVETILGEVRRLKEGIPPEEVDKAKRLITGRLFLRMEDTRAVSSWMGGQELLLGEVMDVDEAAAAVDAVTPEDVVKVANDLLLTEKLNLAVVGSCRGERRLMRSMEL